MYKRQYLDALEIKNLTVRPDKRGRHIASFLMRNAEIEGVREFSVNRIFCDSKLKNYAVRFFLERNHYRKVQIRDLYGLGSGEDIVYKKEIINEYK